MAASQDIDPVTILHEEREVRFLAGIAADPVLALHLAFKGGTALRLVYRCDRYSDDLDFDIIRTGVTAANILRALESVARSQELEVTDAWVKHRTILLEVRVKGWRRKLKVEVSSLLRSSRVPTVVRNIVTSVFPASVNILTYPLSVLLAGKMLAVLERPSRTPRDLYDLFWLLSRSIDEDATYLKLAAMTKATRKLVTDRPLLYRALLECIDQYSDVQIRSELGALLPRSQRRWASAELKERTKELLMLQLAQMSE